MTSKWSSKYEPWEANIAIIANDRKKIWALLKKGMTILLKTGSFLLNRNRVRWASTKGKISTINILSMSVGRGMVSMLPANNSRYIGKSTTCRIKLIGRIDVERDTFPFAMPVNARYQSVQGVTISIIKPIHKAGWSDKKIAPNPQANTGVHIKLMIVLEPRNLIFKNAFFNWCSGIVKNNP